MSQSDKSYNGWSNYETWCVKLWLDNEEGSQRDMERIATHARTEYEGAADLKSYVQDMMPELGGTLWGDLLNSALDEVNWQEIVTGIREDDEGEPA
jgi:hypothetical protein